MKPQEIIERVYYDLDKKVKRGEPNTREVILRTLVEHMRDGNGWRYRRTLCEEFLPEEAACEWPTPDSQNPHL